MAAGGSDPGLAETYASIDDYYSAKLASHGATPLGVDWTCVPTQQLRFVRLLTLCDASEPFSLNDLGCGYGALLPFLEERYRGTAIDYTGIDLSAAMIARARRMWRGRRRARWIVGHRAPSEADYSVASGVFNVIGSTPVSAWERFVATTLADLHASSRKGFAVNFLDPDKSSTSARSILYAPQPRKWADYCEATLGCDTQIVAQYGLREFTLLARPSSSL